MSSKIPFNKNILRFLKFCLLCSLLEVQYIPVYVMEN